MSILPRAILNISAKLEQFLPTQPCLLCGSLSRHGAWCSACNASLPYLDDAHCPVCALPTPDGSPCGRCLKKQPLFARTIAPFAYAFPLDRLVQALKFSGQLHLAHGLAGHLARCVTHRPDCIVPMPLHPARLARRGHNQSLELAKHLSRHLDLPLLPNACLRVRDTPPQSELKWKEREKNMRKAFRCMEDLSGKHVAMVDDVMTTGASLNELALALRRAGAREVSSWVIARTLPHSN